MSKFNRSLAVVIGINNYQNGIDPLQTAVPDAVAIAEILQKNYKYQLTHPDFDSGVIIDRYATKERLKSLLTDILPNEIKPTKGDRLIFYFAGHGIARNSDGGPEGYLVPQDADLKDRDSLLKMRDVHDWLSQLECRHVLIVLDCCFAGTFRWSSYRKLIPVSGEITKAHYDRFVSFPAWQVITSASHNQEALDFLNNRDIQTDKKHSPFAEGLIEALQQEKGDLNNDGVVIATELYLYLRDYVELNSKDRQTPGFFPLKKHDRGEYLFELPGTPLNLKPTPELNKENNPYRGLEPFEARHSRLFFGRDEVIDNLFTKVCQTNNRLTVVSGISGSGKSSLVKAGLIPYLEQEQGQKWLVFEPIRPGSNPYAALARVLAQLNDDSTTRDTTLLGKQLQNPSHKFISAIQAWSHQHRDRRLLLVIDQFEELITMSAKAKLVYSKPKPSRWQKLQQKLSSRDSKLQQDKSLTEPEPWQEFVALLWEILNECPQLSLVITLRSDFEPRFQETAFGSVWTKARFLVRPMRSQELREAVEKPAAEKALYFEPPELVDRLVDEVSQMPGALPLLSFTLSEMYIKLYEAWRDLGEENRALSVTQDFDRQGGVAGVLTRRANYVYDSLGDRATQQMMRKVMLRMVELEGGEALRQRVLTSELVYPEAAENQRKDEVLKRLLAARLIVTGTDTEANQQYYEPAHDFLVRGWDKLQKWIDEEQKKGNLALQSLLIPAAKAWQKESKDLWDNNSRLDRLQEIQKRDSVENNWLNKIESEFIAKSIKKRKSRQRQALSIFTGVTIVLTSLTGAALFSLRNAIFEEISSLVRASDASSNSNQNLGSLPLAIQAGDAFVNNNFLSSTLLSFFPHQDQYFDTKIRKALYQSQGNNFLRNVIDGHSDGITSAEFSSDGNYLITASWDNTAKIWTRDGELITTLEGHQEAVNSAEFSPDNNYIVTASQDNTAKTWTINGELITTLEGHEDWINSAEFGLDGKLILTSSYAGTKLWTVDGELVYAFEGNAEFSSDGEIIVSSFNNNIELWSSESMLQKEPNAIAFLAEDSSITDIELSPNNQFLATISDDDVKIWNVKKLLQGERDSIATFDEKISYVKFSDNGQYIATILSEGNSVKVWTNQGVLISLFEESEGFLKTAKFSPDAEYILTASESSAGKAKILSREASLGIELEAHEGVVNSAEFSPDGEYILTASSDGTAKLWNTEKILNRQEAVIATLEGHEGTVINAKFSPNGQYILTTSSDKTAKLWNTEKILAQQEAVIATLEGYEGTVSSAKFSSDGQYILTISYESDRSHLSNGYNGTAKVWTRNGELVGSIEEEKYTISNAEFSSDGEFIVTAPSINSSDLNAKVWMKDGTAIATLNGHSAPTVDAIFSPDGKHIFTSSYDGTVKVWDAFKIRQGEADIEIATLKAHAGPVVDLESSPDGKNLITSSYDGTAKVWNTADTIEKKRDVVFNLDGHQGILYSGKFSQKNRFVITSSADGTAKIWMQEGKSKRGNLFATFYVGAIDKINNAELSPNENLVLTTSANGVAKLWNLELEHMLTQGCQEIKNYLERNSNLNDRDRAICQNILSSKS